MEKTKWYLQKWFLPVLTSLILLLTFVLSIFLVEKVNQHLEKIDMELQVACSEFFPEARFKEVDENKIKENEDNQITKIFEASQNGERVGFVYLVKVKGFQPDFYVMVGIDEKNKKIVDYKIIEYKETYLDKLTDGFKNQFKQKDITSNSFSLETVAGATFSSSAIVKAAELARKSFYQAINEELPVILISVESLTVNYSAAHYFDCVVKKQDQTYNLVLSYENNAFTVVSGQEGLTETEINAIFTDAKKKLPSAYLFSVADEKIVVKSKGFAGYMTIEFTISGSSVTAIEVTKNAESYNDPYNSGYNPSNGDPIQDLPGQLIGNPNFDDLKVAGATVTSTGIKNAYKLVLEYLSAKGGN